MENIKEHNKKVKEYLNSGRTIEKKIKFIEGEIKKLEMSKKYPSMTNDGMPRGSSQKDLSDYIVAKEELENRLLRSRTKQLEIKNDILEKLEEMDAKEAAVLRMFHLERKKIRNIAKELGYSESHIHRIHSNALKKFEIEEESDDKGD